MPRKRQFLFAASLMAIALCGAATLALLRSHDFDSKSSGSTGKSNAPAPTTARLMTPKNWPPPGYPIVEGKHALTATWAIEVPQPLARRIEDGSVVLWRPGFTIWLSAWDAGKGSISDRLERAKQTASPTRFDERTSVRGNVHLLAYRLHDASDDGPVESLNAFALTADSDLLMSVYFDRPEDEAQAWAIVESAATR